MDEIDTDQNINHIRPWSTCKFHSTSKSTKSKTYGFEKRNDSEEKKKRGTMFNYYSIDTIRVCRNLGQRNK